MRSFDIVGLADWLGCQSRLRQITYLKYLPLCVVGFSRYTNPKFRIWIFKFDIGISNDTFFKERYNYGKERKESC